MDTTPSSSSDPHRIVVGVARDDESTEHAVRTAIALGTRDDRGELHFVAALPDTRGTDLSSLRDRMLEEETWMAEYVRWVGERMPLRAARLDIVLHVRVGSPVDVLTQVATDVDAELIVVGAPHRSRIAQILQGSVPERLFAEGRFPVLVARPVDTTGLAKTPRPEPRRPGERLRDDREALLRSSDRVDFALPTPHVSGLL